MKIGVDAACLAVNDDRLKVGVYQVVFNLLRQLGQLDSQNHYLLYSFATIPESVMALFGPQMANIVVCPAKGWNYFALPLKIFFQKPDLFLGLNQALPGFIACPTVLFVYDLAFEHFPQFYPDSLAHLRLQTRQAARKASLIVTTAAAVKNDLSRLYQIPAAKIKMAYPGYDAAVFKPTKLPEKPYFLFVGALKRLKNIPGLLEGFKHFSDHHARQFKLILAGGDLWLDPTIRPTIQKLDLAGQVETLGHVSTAKLVALYQQATAFVSPSFYEGFGLTFLEAMACGCLVIGSTTGSIPEVVGQAGLLVEPDDAVGLGKALLKIVGNAALRRRLSAAGLVRARHFSWTNFAQDVSRYAKIGLQ